MTVLKDDFKLTYVTRIAAIKSLERIAEKYFSDHEVIWDDFTADELNDPYAGKYGE